MDWFPAMVALMVAGLSFLTWPRKAKIAQAAFCRKEDLPTIKQPLQETFSLEDE